VVSDQVVLALEVNIEELNSFLEFLDCVVIDIVVNWDPSEYSSENGANVGEVSSIPVNPLVNEGGLLGVLSGQA
jgi:hypothetical protein